MSSLFMFDGNGTTSGAAIAVVAVTAFILHAILKYQARGKRRKQLKQWVDAALAKRERKVHECLDLPLKTNVAIPLYTAVETQKKIFLGELNAEVNVANLAKRCRRYARNKKDDICVNAITEEFYQEAYNAAKTKSAGKKLPCLHGVPISVKDCIGLKGALQTGGLACRTSESHRSTQDSAIVRVLRSAGALPMVRGNTGQMMMLPESYNNVWGTTRNPWNLARVPGGSSGGDAAMVAMKCVPLAVGSDVAGSLRIPAAYCGIVGFKPTSTRFTLQGCMRPRKDNRQGTAVIIPSVPGPMARTVDDCALYMKAVCVPELFQTDLSVPPLLFNQNTYDDQNTLKIGYFVTDGWFEPCSAAKRGVMETVEALTKAGHTCVPFGLPASGWDTYALLVSINAADGNMRAYVDALEGESLVPSYKTLYRASNAPNFIRPFLAAVIDKRRANLIMSARSGGLSVHNFWQRCADLIELREMWGKAMIDAGIDAVVHPALPTPAILHRTSGEFTAAYSYCFIANMLLWPAGVIPVTVVREDEQQYKMDSIPRNQRDSFAKLAGKIMEGSAGLPIGVAVMTPAFQDEKCLRVMKEIEKLVKFDQEPQAYKRVDKD